MKSIVKIYLGLILGSLLLLPDFVFADGVVIKPDPFSGRWDYLNESRQQAFINYENGLQKMILSIGTEEMAKNAVWIFPVPADPDKVVIDVLTKLPNLHGEEIAQKAKANLSYIKKALWITQIYPWPFTSWMENLSAPADGEMPTFGAEPSSTKEIEQDVNIYEHLEKEGITTEIITAKTAQGLYNYLQEKNLKIEKGSIPVLDSYIGKEFTFVVSWISSFSPINEETKSKTRPFPFSYQQTQIYQIKQRGVFVTFPTKKIYYPLLPTSVYGSKTIPMTIRVMGFVSPSVFKEIKNYTKTSYFIDEWLSRERELKNFYGGEGEAKNVKYTKIEINAPSKTLTDDLWIEKTTPLKTFPALFIARHPFLIGVILLILISLLIGPLSAIIIFKEARNKKGLIKFALLGLSNCLSIIGLVIATIFTKTKEIKKEDEDLLLEVKRRGYSTWAMQAKDIRKLGFVPLFSISFLIISWFVVKLIELSL